MVSTVDVLSLASLTSRFLSTDMEEAADFGMNGVHIARASARASTATSAWRTATRPRHSPLATRHSPLAMPHRAWSGCRMPLRTLRPSVTTQHARHTLDANNSGTGWPGHD
jgi:hypothetical protein